MRRIARKQIERKKSKTKLIIGSSVISIALIFGTTISFADTDINGLMTSWYNKKAEIAKTAIDTALKSELETQKERVRTELENKMKASSTEIDNYTKQEIETRRQAIIKHADEIINNTKFSTEADKAQIKSKLDNILNSSIKAMDNLQGSYKPPVENYVPQASGQTNSVNTEVKNQETPTQNNNTANTGSNATANNIQANTNPTDSTNIAK